MKKMIAIAAPEYRPLLEAYYERATSGDNNFMQTPHDLATAFDFHRNLLSTGSMKG